MKRATFRMNSARRPLARTSVTKRATVGCVGWPRRFCGAFRLQTPPKGSYMSFAFPQSRRPTTLLPYRGCGSAWVPGSVLGSLVWGVELFSSESTLASLGFRDSFVLRDPDHSKG